MYLANGQHNSSGVVRHKVKRPGKILSSMVPSMSGSEVSGFEWVATLWGLEPRWTIELDEVAIQKTAQLALQRPCPDSIQLLAEGNFNKVFSVGTDNPEAFKLSVCQFYR
ncbi:unnamed protein product [Clonostachys chloroleuca]|uniref:Uncharacterized protein n=1 Tax=Clonostachys chloroleuca TaxID=1926264 RepID=A0AA35M879_9HYPO|nr:unnamed protein product [Clonostachys chloroleuca]